MQIEKYSFGTGDRFAHQGEAQLKALMQASKALGLDIVPVWNKSNREHTIVHSTPADTRREADDTVKALGYEGRYFVDADHINLSNVDKFIDYSDFFTLDVADYIGQQAPPSDIDAFVAANKKYTGQLQIPGIATPFDVPEELLRDIAGKFLYAVREAGRIYRHIEAAKGKDNFVAEVSMDEVNDAQSPVEMFFILSAIADEKIPAQTIAPKFTGRFNKGVDYVGNVAQFAKEFEEDLLVIDFAVKEFGLPDNLKLSIHSGSDKFSIYPVMGELIKKYDKGIHVKTAGTTWLEEIIGLAVSRDYEAVDLAKAIYSGALGRFDELCGPYATVIDINRAKLPPPTEVEHWSGEKLADTLRHIPGHPDYNPNFRQLIHVAYKVAAEYGSIYTDALERNKETVGRQVTENIYDRHIKRLFGMKKYLVPVLFFCCFFVKTNAQILWFDRPAGQWESTLPLGNGRIGMTPDGGIEKETLTLNDITLWSGGVHDADNPDAARYLPEIRQLLFEGKNDQAQELMYKTFVCKGGGSGGGKFGSFEMLGSLHIDYRYPSEHVTAGRYRRQLSLNDATASMSFVSDGVTYTREYLAAFGHDVLVVRLSASKKGCLNFTVGIDRPQAFETTLDGDVLLMKGQLNNGTDGKGMRYNARVKVIPAGAGKVSGRDNRIELTGAQEAFIFVSATTDYKDPLFESKCQTLLQQAVAAKYADIKTGHVKAYRHYFDRMHLHLKPHPGKDTIPADRRLLAFAADPADNGLVELYFQYGRYLLISSARPGLLPPNLQGLWANSVRPPWNSDYHLDINAQMNHWPVEPTNLAELHQPLIQLIESLVEPGRRTAKAFYNADGWISHVITNVWGFTSPGEHPSWGATNTGGTWLCAHLWEHYDYSRDRQYLQRIYPVLKGSAEFFLSILVPEPKHGWLVTAPTTSPENSFYLPETRKSASVCMGSTMDNQLVRETFSNVIAASEILNVDADLRNRLKESVTRLPPNRIGSDGRLMEWLEEYEETDPHHRHVSHLYGLYPGAQITLKGTPDLAEAARKALEARGDGGTGWSRAWKINFWARLGDGNHAYTLLCNLLKPTFDSKMDYSDSGGTYPNLFCAHPPFQIDGNFGGSAGIAEMFVQSHSGVIELLPALPDAIPDGSFDGMRVRGGAEVSAAWKDKKLTSATLKATADNTFKFRIPGNVRCTFTKGKKSIHPEIADNVAIIPLKAGETVTTLMKTI
ncbi:MAG: glycoside hydrolase N-terminal domain-containing protein [Tannerella sp.]|jgi:alpha-L-fucosidase 2|nr:glycoside hydrolase N-terminal domain-containing protein [Tannerella sp.]